MDLAAIEPYRASLEYLRAVDEAPDWDYPHVLLARLYERRMAVSMALDQYEEACRIGVSQVSLEPLVYLRAGHLSAAKGLYEAASRYFRRAEGFPHYRAEAEAARRDLADIGKALSFTNTDPAAAETGLRDIVSRRSAWIAPAIMFARLLEEERKTEEAETVCRNILDQRPVRSLTLLGDLDEKESGQYVFAREALGSGEWTLSVRFPPGEYRYLFVENFRLSGERRFPDPDAASVESTPNGEKYARLEVKSTNAPTRFRYRTFPDDPVFSEAEELFENLRQRKLNPFYRRSPYFGEEALGKEVKFAYRNPAAYAVWIVGDFNQWGQDYDNKGNQFLSPKFYWPMLRDTNDGTWRVTSKLAPGRGYYKYNFVVNESFVSRDPIVPVSLSNLPVTDAQALAWGKESYVLVEGAAAYDVEFVIPRNSYPTAQTMWLVGSFNRWGGTADGGALSPSLYINLVLDHEAGLWRTHVKLPAGKYQYKFVIDGKTWVSDPLTRKNSSSRDMNSSIAVNATNTNNYAGHWEPVEKKP